MILEWREGIKCISVSIKGRGERMKDGKEMNRQMISRREIFENQDPKDFQWLRKGNRQTDREILYFENDGREREEGDDGMERPVRYQN